MGPQELIEDAIELGFALLVYEAVFEDARGLVDQDLHEGLGITDVITKQAEDKLGDISRGEEVVTMLID